MTILTRDPGVGWVDPSADTPPFLRTLVESIDGITAHRLTRFTPPEKGGRRAAVLALFGDGAHDALTRGPTGLPGWSRRL